MPKTFNQKEIKELYLILFNKYLKLTGKVGRKFEDIYLCFVCQNIQEESGSCIVCKKPKLKKNVLKKTKKKSNFPRVLRS